MNYVNYYYFHKEKGQTIKLPTIVGKESKSLVSQPFVKAEGKSSNIILVVPWTYRIRTLLLHKLTYLLTCLRKRD